MENPIDLDETPPLVHITYPANQSTLSGSVLVTAYAYDERKLEKVRLYLDDSIIFQSNIEPYEVIWNTLLYKDDASYIINAEAEDSSGNKTFSKSIEVKIVTFGTKNIYVLCSSACVRAKTLNIKLTNVLVSAQVYLREEEKRLRKEDRTQQIIICAIGVVRRKYGSFLLGRIFKILVYTHSKIS